MTVPFEHILHSKMHSHFLSKTFFDKIATVMKCIYILHCLE